MARLTPTSIQSTYSAIAALNANFDDIANLFEICLFRDGSTPNAMNANLDMNHNRIENVGAPLNDNDAVRLVDIKDLSDSDAFQLTITNPSGAGVVGYDPSGDYPLASVGNAIIPSVTTRVELATIPPREYKLANLVEAGREGTFICRVGTAPTDPLQGIYVASDTAGFYWERRWDGIHGHPEWFGAVPGSGADCSAALLAGHALCPVLLLADDKYSIYSPVTFDTPYRKVIGIGAYGYGGSGSIIEATFTDETALHIGPEVKPGSAAEFINELYVEDLTVTRSVTRVPGDGSEPDCQRGVRINYLLRSFVRNVTVREFGICFDLGGLIYTKIRDCAAFITSNATSPTNDIFRGFVLDSGLTIFPGYPGGNASLFIENCSVIREGSPTIVDPIGMVVRGYLCDVYISDFETAGIAKGMVITGTGPGDAAPASNGNVYINHPILDQCAPFGIEIYSLSPTAAVEINNPYIALAPTAGGSDAGIFWHDNGGRVTVLGGQISCIYNNMTGGTSMGINAASGVGLSVIGTKIIDAAYPVKMVGVRGFRMLPEIYNPTYGTRPQQSAMYFEGCERGFVQPSITGKSGAFAVGCYLSGANNKRLNIDPTMIDPDAIPASVTNKVMINGSAITTAGYYTPSGGSGGGLEAIAVLGVLG